jgi:hypothetical protein
MLPTTIRQSIEEMNAYHLAEAVGCATPDTPESPGAVFLTSVRDRVLEAIGDVDDDDLVKLGDALEDTRHEIADNAPDVYTATRWAEFTDLGAYREDLSDIGFSAVGAPTIDGATDLTAAAGTALYSIAERLVSWLVDYAQTELATAVDNALEAVADLGSDHGNNAADWWQQDAIGGRASGDTRGVARRVLEGLADGDPEIVDGLPSADLSGQWADGPTVRSLLDDHGLAGLDPASEIGQEIGDAYETAFNDACHAAIERYCRAALEGEDA